MEILPFILVFVSSFSHAYWNFLAKQAIEKDVFIGLSKVVEALLFGIPFLLILNTEGFILSYWYYVIVASVFVFLNYFFLSQAYKRIDLSIAYRNLGRYEEAIASLKEALARNPDWIVTYYCQAINYLMAWSTKQSKDPLILERALEMAKKAVAIDDSSFEAHFELSTIYLYKQQYEKALVEAEKLIALAPENADDYAHLADIFNHIGRSGEAIEMVEQAMQLNPAIPAWYLTTLGAAYALSGRQTESVATHKKVFQHNPSHENAFNARLSLAILYAELDQEEDARAEAEEILKLLPIFSVEIWGQRNSNIDQAQIKRDMAALRKAGLK